MRRNAVVKITKIEVLEDEAIINYEFVEGYEKETKTIKRCSLDYLIYYFVETYELESILDLPGKHYEGSLDDSGRFFWGAIVDVQESLE